MPVTIGIFVNPTGDRSNEYDTANDKYGSFLVKEMLPEVAKSYNLSKDPEAHAIAGQSSGGSCAFTVGWFFPNDFRKVVTHNGSFVKLSSTAPSNVYPGLVRGTDKKPLRVFLLSGTNDNVQAAGSWAEENKKLAAALKEKGYHYRFVFGDGGHFPPVHAASNLPDTLRWMWRDYKPND